MTKHVNINKILSEHLVFRISCNALFDELETLEDNEIVIDFSNVKTISRSFAHQYLIRKSTSNKIIREENLPDNINKMLEIVKMQLDKPRTRTSSSNFPVITI